MGINTAWTRHIKDPEIKKSMEQAVKHDTLVLARLADILKEKIESTSFTNTLDYDRPSWAYRQAHINGLLSAYKEILNLITAKEKN